jgi:hypothetical protein
MIFRSLIFKNFQGLVFDIFWQYFVLLRTRRLLDISTDLDLDMSLVHDIYPSFRRLRSDQNKASLSSTCSSPAMTLQPLDLCLNGVTITPIPTAAGKLRPVTTAAEQNHDLEFLAAAG